MKILFLGHYREGDSGWSRAAQELITALDSVGADVVCRPVVLTGGGTPNNTVLKCEAKSVKNCDIVIQCLLPHHMSYNGNFKKNIALPFLETQLDSDNDWLSYFESMDEVWVSSDHLYTSGITDRLREKIRHINIPTDVSKYNKIYPNNKIDHLYDNYVFYYIGDVNKRKNIGDLVRAFQLEFTKNEPVSLVLKVNKFGMSQEAIQNMVYTDINHINDSLRLYSRLEQYNPVTVIANHIPEEGINGLHQMFDCYVSASRGEGWNFPLVDAIGFGKEIVTTNYPRTEYDGEPLFEYDGISMMDYGTTEPVTHMYDMFSNQFTAKESWDYVHINSLRYCMREAFTTGKKKYTVDMSPVSYENVGNSLMELIYESN